MGKTEYFETFGRTARRPILSLPNASSVNQPSLPSKAATAPPTYNTRYPHPVTGIKNFGLVPPIKGLAQPLCAAPIVLTHGWQTEAESGMGVCHIWKQHASELRAFGYGSVEDVPDFVARIVKPGASIIRLPDERGEVRLGVYNNLVGIVVLGPKRCGRDWEWRVITAYDPTWFCAGDTVGRVVGAASIQGLPAR